MKLVWCPETASKAYLDAVRSLSALGDLEEDSNVAELIAAMAGGWKAQLVVEALSRGDSPATSLALAAALRQTSGRRVIIDEDEEKGAEREEEVGDVAVDFMVVDMRRRDAGRVVRGAKVGPRGMVVVCKNVDVAEKRNFKGAALLERGMRLVRSAYLPIGRGVEILHVGVGKGPRLGGGCGRCNRWFKHVDRTTGEEHLFRK